MRTDRRVKLKRRNSCEAGDEKSPQWPWPCWGNAAVSQLLWALRNTVLNEKNFCICSGLKENRSRCKNPTWNLTRTEGPGSLWHADSRGIWWVNVTEKPPSAFGGAFWATFVALLYFCTWNGFFWGKKEHVKCTKIKRGGYCRWAGPVKHHVCTSGRNHIPGWLHCSDPGSSSGHWAEGNAAALGPGLLHTLHGKDEVKNSGACGEQSRITGEASNRWLEPLVQCKKGWIGRTQQSYY